MPAPEKRPSKRRPSQVAKPRPSPMQRFTVVLEDMRSQFMVFGEALQALDQKVDRRFEQVDREIGLLKVAVIENSREIKDLRSDMDEVRGELTDIRGELTDIRGELTDIRGELTDVRGELTDVRGELTDVRGELRDVRGALVRVEEAVEKKVDRADVEAIVARARSH